MWWWRLEAEQGSLPPSLGLLLPLCSNTAWRFCTSCQPDVQDCIPTGRLWQSPWELNDNNLSTRHHHFSFFSLYSIILYLMSLFLVPKLPVVYFCSFLQSVFFNFNDIPLLRLFFRVSALLYSTWGSGEGGRNKRRGEEVREVGKARMYQLFWKIQRFKMWWHRQ